MDSGKRTEKVKSLYRSFCTVLKNERGYTYIELTITLSLLIVLFPAVFFLTNTLEAEFKKMVNREQLQMEYMAFHAFMMREINQATRFRLQGKDVIVDLPTGESIRYQFKKRQIMRSVKRCGEMHYLGTTIVLQHVYFCAIVPDENGVYIDVGLQNWYSSLDLNTYIGKRVDAACGQMNVELPYPS